MPMIREGQIKLSNPTTASMPSLTPDVIGDYTIQLVVTDSLGAASAPDTVVVSTTNSAPVADAGADQLVISRGTVVQLNGMQSFDDNGNTLNLPVELCLEAGKKPKCELGLERLPHLVWDWV